MTERRRLLALLEAGPMSVSALARALGATRGQVERDLPHLLRSAAAAGRVLVVVPARCRACDFEFPATKLDKPSRCPQCHQSRIFEPQIRLE